MTQDGISSCGCYDEAGDVDRVCAVAQRRQRAPRTGRAAMNDRSTRHEVGLGQNLARRVPELESLRAHTIDLAHQHRVGNGCSESSCFFDLGGEENPSGTGRKRIGRCRVCAEHIDDDGGSRCLGRSFEPLSMSDYHSVSIAAIALSNRHSLIAPSG